VFEFWIEGELMVVYCFFEDEVVGEGDWMFVEFECYDLWDVEFG